MPPLPSPVSKPTITSGAAAGLLHATRPVRESTMPPLREALEKPPAGVCCCNTAPLRRGDEASESVSMAKSFPEFTM